MDQLIAAVRAGDARAAEEALWAGADPDAVDAHGTCALRLAVDAFDLPMVSLLTDAFARLDRPGADGRTPLLRAVELGAGDIVHLLVGRGARLWLTDPEGRDALTLARHWYGRDLVAELYRRTGRHGPVARRVIRLDSDAWCAELSLDGLAFRAAHAAILTRLEPKYGIAPPFGELLARALAEPGSDPDHEVFAEASLTLSARRDPATWAAAAALRDHPEPLARCFGAEVLRLTQLFDESEEQPFGAPLIALFLPWAADESDPRVVRRLAAGLSDTADPRCTQALLALTRHADREVRRRAVVGLRGAVAAGEHAVRTAVIECTADEDPAVRREACAVLAAAPADDREAAEALAARLADPEEGVRVEAAARLALRDDPRGDGVLEGVHATDEDSPYYWTLYDVARHRYLRSGS